MEGSEEIHAPIALSQKTEQVSPWIGGTVSPRAGLDFFVYSKIREFL
jgi:hypothetical protein